MTTVTIILLIFMLVVLSLSLLTIFAITIMQIYGGIVSVVPLVPVKHNALESIMEALDISPGDILYDLGSGDGRVLEYALKKYPTIKAIGLEISPWPRLESRMRLRKYNKRVEIRNQNFFKSDFSGATHIYLYLFPKVMNQLEPLFNQKLTPGTRVVSCDFVFPNKTPDRIIVVPHNKTLSKKIYIYTW